MTTKPYNNSTLRSFFIDYLVAENLTKSTIANYLCDFDHFMGWVSLEVSLDLRTLNLGFISLNLETLIKGYKSYLKINEIPFSTFSRKSFTLRKFVKACRQMKIIDELSEERIGQILTLRKPINLSWKNLISSFQKEVKPDLFDQNTILELKKNIF